MAEQKKKDDEHKPAKVDKWDAHAVKNALDDAVKYLMKTDFNCDEDHSLMNGRLALSSIGVAFALFGCLWDYLHPFPESKPVLLVCVISYFFFMGILTLYSMYKEKGIMYVGLQKDKAGVDPPNIWTFTSNQHKYDDMYELEVEYKDVTSGQPARTAKFTDSVTNYFDEKGNLREDLFHPKVKQLCHSLQKAKKSN